MCTCMCLDYFVDHNRSRLKTGIARCAAKRKNITTQICHPGPLICHPGLDLGSLLLLGNYFL